MDSHAKLDRILEDLASALNASAQTCNSLTEAAKALRAHRDPIAGKRLIKALTRARNECSMQAGVLDTYVDDLESAAIDAARAGNDCVCQAKLDLFQEMKNLIKQALVRDTRAAIHAADQVVRQGQGDSIWPSMRPDKILSV